MSSYQDLKVRSLKCERLKWSHNAKTNVFLYSPVNRAGATEGTVLLL